MKRSWYQTSKLCTALRKHVLRVDLCVFIDEEKVFSDENYLNSTIKSILTAAIIKGLDIIGILTPQNPSIGWKAVQMAKTQQMDIVVVPGQTYICQEGIELYIYNMQQPLKSNLTFAEACRTAHSYSGFVVATNITKRQALLLDKLQGSDSAPYSILKLVVTEILILISQNLFLPELHLLLILNLLMFLLYWIEKLQRK